MQLRGPHDVGALLGRRQRLAAASPNHPGGGAVIDVSLAAVQANARTPASSAPVIGPPSSAHLGTPPSVTWITPRAPSRCSRLAATPARWPDAQITAIGRAGSRLSGIAVISCQGTQIDPKMWLARH